MRLSVPGFTSRLRMVLIVRISAILLAVIVLVGVNLYQRATREVAEITDRIILSTGRLIDQRLEALLTGTASQAELMAEVLKPAAVSGGDEGTVARR
ncbi:MAG: hypothetical protein MH204_10470, partial [Fimbriimonadaceae bacterium]|nr:hypothetical protein [Fimbriimonadaceae bacterium]